MIQPGDVCFCGDGLVGSLLLGVSHTHLLTHMFLVIRVVRNKKDLKNPTNNLGIGRNPQLLLEVIVRAHAWNLGEAEHVWLRSSSKPTFSSFMAAWGTTSEQWPRLILACSDNGALDGIKPDLTSKNAYF